MSHTQLERFASQAARQRTLVELLGWRAAHQPDRVAYTLLADGDAEESRLTFAELDRRARETGARLQAEGAAGERVMLLCPPGLEYVIAFFGCLYAGSVAVPAYPPRNNRALTRLQNIAHDSQAKFALVAPSTPERTKSLLERVRGASALKVLSVEASPEGAAESWRPAESDENSLAFLQYTSGSTNAPRGVMVTHAQLLRQERLIERAFHQTEDSVIVSWLPLYHDMGLIGSALQPLHLGASCIFFSPAAFLQRPLRWLRAISRFKATTSGGPNFAYDLCVNKITPEERATLDLSSWRVAFNGSEPVRAETLERFAATFEPCGFRAEAFYPCYGLAEATLLVSCGARPGSLVRAFDKTALAQNRVVEVSEGETDARPLVSCGRPLLEGRTLIVEPDTRVVCQEHTVGEIWLAGASLAGGYWNSAGETERVFHARLAPGGEGPFLRTGDLGFQLDGELFITGRLKDLIIIRGLNHYPHDIELTSESSHPSFRPGSSAAFSIEVEGGERLAVLQEVDPFQKISPAQLIEDIRVAINEAHEIQPYAVALVKRGELPKTSSGKIQRGACRDAFIDGRLSIVAQWQDDTTALRAGREEAAITDHFISGASVEAIESWLVSYLSAKLKISADKIEPEHTLIHYGLDSLMAVDLMHSLETRLGVRLSVASFFQELNIRQLAGLLHGQMQSAPPEAAPDTAALPARSGVEHPLSYSQSAMWFLQQLDPESAAYNIASAMSIRNALDTHALRRAFLRLVERHASLRTVFVARGGEPFQIVREQSEPFFYETDAENFSEAVLDEYLVNESRRPFDLAAGPVLRVNLLRRSAWEHVLLLVVHHIVADFWSLSVLAHELGQLYTAELTHTEAKLDALPIQYTDWVAARNEMLAGSEGERLWDYWKEQLKGDLPYLNLPLDAPRPAQQTFRGSSISFSLSPELAAGLKKLHQAEEATLYMLLLAAFKVLLYRYSGQKDILVGSSMSGRGRAELAGLIGYLANPIVLRADLTGRPTFREFLGRVRRTVLTAFEHQDYPFALLVERLLPHRDFDRSPLFQVAFVLQKAQLPEEESLAAFSVGGDASVNLGGIQLETLELKQQIAPFEMTLTMAEVEGELRGTLKYNSDLFAPDRIERMVRHYEHLLTAVVQNPQASISQLQMLSEAERQQLLHEFNQTTTDYPSSASINELFSRQARQTPDAPALLFEGRTLSYRELDARSNQLAHYLQDCGAGVESLVGVLLPRSLEMVVSLLAVLKTGGAYVPLDPAYPLERLSLMMEDAGLAVLLTKGGMERESPGFWGRTVLLDEQWDEISSYSTGLVESGVEPENVAYVIYTSGSTGAPKGVMVSHQSVVNLALAQAAVFEVERSSRILQFASLSFDASVSEIFMALLSGAALVVAQRERLLPGADLLELLEAERITNVTLPPTALTVLESRRLPALQSLIAAGEKSEGELLGRWAEGRAVYNAYGPTECAVCATVERYVRDGREVGIGKPIANVEVYVLDEEMQAVPVGVDGELHIAGAGLARGYLHRPSLTAEKFIPHPFSTRGGERMYRTGDIGRYRADGTIEYIGRMDEQVKVRGYRIELGEIEHALRQHGQVRDCVVIAQGDGQEKRLIAYLVAEAGEELQVEAVRNYLREKLPEYMIPAVMMVLDEIPLSPNGKVNRKALPDPEMSRPTFEHKFEGARTATEETLLSIWQDVLKVSPIGIHDNFFELGGYSLLMTQVASRVRDIFNVELSVQSLFQHPTIADLAGVIDVGHRQTENEEDLARLLDRLEEMTDEELDALL